MAKKAFKESASPNTRVSQNVLRKRLLSYFEETLATLAALPGAESVIDIGLENINTNPGSSIDFSILFYNLAPEPEHSTSLGNSYLRITANFMPRKPPVLIISRTDRKGCRGLAHYEEVTDPKTIGSIHQLVKTFVDSQMNRLPSAAARMELNARSTRNFAAGYQSLKKDRDTRPKLKVA